MPQLRRLTQIIALCSLPGALACEKELTLSPPVNPADFTEAQFDPTNPIPVLQIVPSPTALAERQDGPGLTVVPAPCELPSTKQCLAFVEGWPNTTPVTLYFSNEVDESTIKAGIKFLKLMGPGVPPEPVEYDFVANVPRPAPNPGCKEGENGSNPPRTYTDDDVPPGVQVILTPQSPLDPASTYTVLVESHAEGGVRAKADGKIVQPSALFTLMNTPRSSAPVCVFDTSTGEMIDERMVCREAGESAPGLLLNALLRGQVQGGYINANFEGKTYPELTAEQQAEVDAFTAATTEAGLSGLYHYFDAFLTPLTTPVAEGAPTVTTRDKLVFATLWHTAPDRGTLAFDPLNSVIPFPNVQLLTSSTGPGLNDVQVAIPPDPNDSPISALLKQNLNTLNGFSVAGAMTVPSTKELDLASLEGNVIVWELDETGMPVEEAVFTATVTRALSTGVPPQIAIVPIKPLKQNTTYVVAIKKGVKDTDGMELGMHSTFDLLKSPVPALEGTTVDPNIVPALQCSTVATTGMLADDMTVLGTADAIENQLNRARWQVAFNALKALPTPIERDEVLMAWTHKTQDITGTIDLARSLIFQDDPTMGWEGLALQAGMPRIEQVPVVPNGPMSIVGTSSIASFLGIVDQFCVQLLCGSGQIEPATCAMGEAAIIADPLCQLAVNLVAGELGEVRKYMLTTYKVLTGNPFDPTQGTFTPQRFMMPKVERVPVWVVLPASAGPYPATIFQHGITRYKEDGFFIANTLALAGRATILMDAPYHGERVSDLLDNATFQVCADPNSGAVVNPDDVTCVVNPSDGTGVCNHAQGPACDGVPDPSGAAAFLTPSPFTLRDNVRQMTIDHLALMRALQKDNGGAFQALPGIMNVLTDIDGARISYVGQSAGGIVGGALLPYAPELQSVVLNVAGGGIRQLLFETPTFAGLTLGALADPSVGLCDPIDPADLSKGCQPTPDFLQFLATLQWVTEPGDPLGLAVGVNDAHNGIPAFGTDRVLMQMVVPDTTVLNKNTLRLALAYGLNPADNSDTSHFQTYAFATNPANNCHGFLLAPDLVNCESDFETMLCATLGAQRQAARFVASDAANIGPQKEDIAPPFLLCP